MKYDREISLKCPYCHSTEIHSTADMHEGPNTFQCTSIGCEKYYVIDITLFHKLFTYKLIPSRNTRIQDDDYNPYGEI